MNPPACRHLLKPIGLRQDVDQLVDPFSTLFFLQSHGALHADFLRALCQWSLKGVHRPNVRSERRPTSQQLVILHDFCFECLGPEEDFRRFVMMRIIRASKGKFSDSGHCFLFARITFDGKIFLGVKEFFCFGVAPGTPQIIRWVDWPHWSIVLGLIFQHHHVSGVLTNLTTSGRLAFNSCFFWHLCANRFPKKNQSNLRYGLEEEPALQDALAFFVESGGGLWHHIYPQPLAYHKKRRYIRGLVPERCRSPAMVKHVF